MPVKRICDSDYVYLFKKKVIEAIPNLLKQSGAVLYSSYCTLKEDDFYILGFNPGGDPLSMKDATILSDLESEKKYDPNYSEYYEKWSDSEEPLQKNIKLIVEDILTRKVESICSSNLLFIRSQGENAIPNWQDIANKCWQVHQFLIYKIILPKVIISFGIRTFDFLMEKLSYDRGFFFPAKHGNWKIKAFVTNAGPRGSLTVIGFPHLSRYHLYTLNDSDFKAIKDWVHELIRN